MTHDAIRASWAIRGQLARAVHFTISEEYDYLVLMADSRAPGRLMRAFRSLPMAAADDAIEAALDGLYTDLTGLPAVADKIANQTFSERLADE